jgi:hypothetical protein
MDKKMVALDVNATWELVALPKDMYTWMLIGLVISFWIKDQPVVSCFLLEVVMLVGAVKNNQ